MPSPQKIRCLVNNIIEHGNHVYSLLLIPERRIPKFKAGQFLHFAIDEYDPSGYWPESRVFSIASSPLNRSTVRITYSVKGSYTSRMEKELVKGKNVWIKMPYGDFTINNYDEVVLMAGGTGITAFTAFIEQECNNRHGSIVIVYGVKAPELLIYKNIIEDAAKLNSDIRIIYFIESQSGNRGLKDIHKEIKGIIATKKIFPYLNNKEKAKYYLSGPPTMIKGLKKELLSNRISLDNIYIDAWT